MQYSESESRRFGLRVFRYSADFFDPEQIQALTVDNAADLVICRVPAIYLSRLSELSMPYVTGDFLMYYGMSLAGRSPTEIEGSISFDKCSEADIPQLEETVSTVFDGYVNHYSSNPLLDPKLILEGQVEWAVSLVKRDDCAVFLPKIGGKIVGFFIHRYDENTIEYVLGGVTPEARGQGVYYKSMKHIINVALARNCQKMLSSTQAHNLAIQRAWIREGLTLEKALLTFHINAMLAQTLEGK